jgi:cellobiose dehydrogenase (acceptor)
MTITQYLGTGAKSRGRMTITSALNTRVATSPYLNDAADKAAVIKGIENVQGYFNAIQNLTWVRPSNAQNATAYVNSVSGHFDSPHFPLFLSLLHILAPIEQH